MLECTNGYKSAIVGDVRQMAIKAIIEMVSPDLVYVGSDGSQQTDYSKPAQLYDKDVDISSMYATYELGRWLLNGEYSLVPEIPQNIDGEVGFVGSALSGIDGAFPAPQIAQVKFSGVSVLQAFSVFFSKSPSDGFPVDFTVDVMLGNQSVYSKEFVNNKKTEIYIDGFLVNTPDSIRVTATKWSLPNRHMRVAEIVPGFYETWTEDTFASVDIQMRSNFACLAIPYGTCNLRLDNFDRRFEPRNKKGVFRSIEERQKIPVFIGTKVGGRIDYKPVGVYYQFSGGWKTSDNDTTIEWNLVDIIGLISEREYIAPKSLPTTLGGWAESIVSQLGPNFSKSWSVDPEYIALPVTADSVEDVTGKKCGDILRYACMATGTFPRADAETGNLAIEPLWNQGNKITLDNMINYPTIKANEDLAVLTFRLYDSKKTVYNISGNATASSKTLSVDNPFIHTKEQAFTAAKQILSQYGGNIFEFTGRGDPASEIGDVDTLWLDESTASTARRMEQGFSFSSGVLSDCKSTLLQADGSYLFSNVKVFTESGKFRIPDGVIRPRLILVGGGQGSEPGSRGTGGDPLNSPQPGKPGSDGLGGKVWAGLIDVNPGIEYDIIIGTGGKKSEEHGKPGAFGTPTTFGSFSSENGEHYDPNFTDIATGNAYGRSAVEKPVANTGDGGKGGAAGSAGSGYLVTERDEQGHQLNVYWVTETPGGPGGPGVDGASGICILSWEVDENA